MKAIEIKTEGYFLNVTVDGIPVVKIESCENRKEFVQKLLKTNLELIDLYDTQIEIVQRLVDTQIHFSITYYND